MGGRGTHILRHTQMCSSNRSLFHKKSLNMGTFCYKRIPKHGSIFPMDLGFDQDSSCTLPFKPNPSTPRCLSLSMLVSTADDGSNFPTFIIFFFEIQIFKVIFRFTIHNAFEWVQTSLVLVQWLLRKSLPFLQNAVKFQLFVACMQTH